MIFGELKFEKIVSFTSAVNVRSGRVMKRVGMKYIAEFDHPEIEMDSILCRHVRYGISRREFYHS